MGDLQVNQDKSPEPSTSDAGKQTDVRMVPEKDLLAVKAGKETAEKSMKSAQEELNRVRSELKSLQEQQSNTVADLSGKLAAAESKVTAAEQAKQTAEGELSKTKEAGLQAKRRDAVERGISEEKANNLSEDALDALIETLKKWRPKPDMGMGTGTKGLEGLSPRMLTHRAYEQKSK